MIVNVLLIKEVYADINKKGGGKKENPLDLACDEENEE